MNTYSFNIVIVYSSILQNIVLLNIEQLEYFFMYNDYNIHKKYTIISLFDSSQYGELQDDNIIKMIVIISKLIIRYVIVEKILKNVPKASEYFIKISHILNYEKKFIKENITEINRFYKQFILRFIKNVGYKEQRVLPAPTQSMFHPETGRYGKRVLPDPNVDRSVPSSQYDLIKQFLSSNKKYYIKYMKYKNKFLNLRKQIEEFNVINEKNQRFSQSH